MANGHVPMATPTQVLLYIVTVLTITKVLMDTATQKCSYNNIRNVGNLMSHSYDSLASFLRENIVKPVLNQLQWLPWNQHFLCHYSCSIKVTSIM